VEFVGFADPDGDRAANAAKRFNTRAFDDYGPLYKESKPDAVYVGVPPFAHGDIEIDAAKRGIALCVEKPIARERTVAKEIGKVIRSTGVVCSVTYYHRYLDTVAFARKYLKGKPIGLALGRWCGQMRRETWWRKRDQGGGPLVQEITMLFDLLRYLCGEVAEVHAFSSRGALRLTDEIDVEESCAVALRLKTGASASISYTCILPLDDTVRLEIYTPDATLTLRDGVLRITEGNKITEYRPSFDMIEAADGAFIDSVRSNRANGIRSLYSDALKSFSISAAAVESAASGMPTRP